MAKKKKVVEKHISVSEEAHARLEKLAETQKRSMRAVLDIMLDKAEKELGL